MSRLYPDDDPNRLGMLVNSLTKTFRKLAEQENFTPDQMFLAAANAAALYATDHGFDSLDVFKVQEVMILEVAEHRRAKKWPSGSTTPPASCRTGPTFPPASCRCGLPRSAT
jgi:hypothetical protein